MRKTSLIPGMLVSALACTTLPAHALIGLNQCGVGTKPPAGLHCGHDELLLGYRNAAGACVWICCPPNSDGKTYNCSGEPTPSDSKLDLRNIRAKPPTSIFTPEAPPRRPPGTKRRQLPRRQRQNRCCA